MILPHDRQIAAWLAEGPDQGPSEPLARALVATRRTSKRPRWSFPERWLPMQLTFHRPLVPRAVVYLALLALLIAALGVAALLVPGSQQVPAPLGAANGSIAYDAGGQLYVANPDGSDPRPLPQADKYAYSPAYSPDGSRIAYWSNDTPDRLQLFVAAADGTGATMVSEVSFDSNTKFAPIWSPDGRWLVYAGRDGGVYKVAADASTTLRVASGWSPTVSPDGAWIAYRSDSGSEALLRVVSSDGGESRTLTSGSATSDHFATMRWTADSQEVVFHRGGIHAVALDGTERQLSPEGAYPTVSPDGRWVSFLVETSIGVEELRLVDLETGEARTLTDRAGCMAVWSPDSTSIVTFANGCFTDLLLVPVDDPAAATVLDVPADIGGMAGWQAVSD
jgi:Tol biopolymer transport system component